MIKTVFIPLSQSKIDKEYKIFKVNSNDNPIFRRMMDIGIMPGTVIKVLHESASKNLKAYKIRGAVIALRDNDASKIIAYEI